MEDVTITTCRRDDEAWFIRMNELEIDEYDQSASGTGATLHFQGVPILARPGSPSRSAISAVRAS